MTGTFIKNIKVNSNSEDPPEESKLNAFKKAYIRAQKESSSQAPARHDKDPQEMTELRVVTTATRILANAEETREPAEFILSTYARDSHHTVVNQSNWKLERYLANPVVGYQHQIWGGRGMCEGSDPDDLIGTSRVYLTDDPKREGKQMLVGIPKLEPREINERAEKVFRKVLFGSLKATSVGFAEAGKGQWGEEDEARGQRNETYYFHAQELFEWSLCHMGSNPETISRSLTTDMRAAIAYLKLQIPELSTRDVYTMTVRDILCELEGKPVQAAFRSTTRSEQRQQATSFIRDTYLS